MTSRYAEDIPYECGSGWNDLIDDTLDTLYSIDPGIEILQVKEKFGTLRLYYHTEYEHGTPKAMNIGTTVKQAEAHSERVCETCGHPGRMVSKNRWYFTACEKHAGEATPVDD